jgi:predicted dehydrogenase
MQIRVALFGVGRWGKHFLRLLLQHPFVTLTAIADPYPQALADCQQQFNLDPQILLTTDWQGLLASTALDAVIVTTTASSHYDVIMASLRVGCHVLAEKPLCLTVAECEQVIQLAQAQQRHLWVDHTYLFHPAIKQGKEIIESGQLGELRYGYSSRTHLGPVRQDVDALWDLSIHDLCIFSHWLGEFPQQVQAQGRYWLQENVADLVWANLSYPSGFQASLHLCWLNPDKQRRLVIVGNQGSLIFDELAPNPLILQKGEFEHRDHAFIPVAQETIPIVVPSAEPLQQVCHQFLAAVSESLPPNLDQALLGLKLVEILTALGLSCQQSGEPMLISSDY